MSKYTTGEVAKLCNVSVRTVQYYDNRGILIPSELSEGGRRQYSESDLDKMRIICYLRELDLPIDSIKDLLSEEHPENVISILLDQQEKQLKDEISDMQEKVDKISETKKSLQRMSSVTVNSIKDVAHIMDNKKKLRSLRIKMISLGIVMDLIEIATIILWIFKGIWLPFAIGMVFVVLLGIYVSCIYFNNTAYICPECHKIFKPKFANAFFAPHTPNTRKLTCTSCGHRGFCVETYCKKEDMN